MRITPAATGIGWQQRHGGVVNLFSELESRRHNELATGITVRSNRHSRPYT